MEERSLQGLQRLPGTGRLWVFGIEPELNEPEERRLEQELDRFLAGWRAHGAALAAAWEIRERRFLLVGVDDRVELPSGCSIDALVHVLKGLETELGRTIVDSAPVWYRAGGAIRRSSRPEFRALAEAGEVTADSVVFDMSVTRLAQLDAGEWERPARESWHGRAFFRDAAV